MIKYTSEWKADQLRKRGHVSVKTRNRSLQFTITNEKMFVIINGKEYEILNCGTTLYAVADEKDFIEVEIINPDEIIGRKLILFDLEITPRLW